MRHDLFARWREAGKERSKGRIVAGDKHADRQKQIARQA
jgi:hypothetical protein